MNKSALLKMADMLDDMPTDRFEIKTFIGGYGELAKVSKDPFSCGAVACAVGHAAFQPWAHAEGYFFDHELQGALFIDRDGQKTKGFGHASRRWLNLNSDQWEWLFQVHSYRYDEQFDQGVPPCEGAARIRDFVQAGGIP